MTDFVDIFGDEAGIPEDLVDAVGDRPCIVIDAG